MNNMNKHNGIEKKKQDTFLINLKRDHDANVIWFEQQFVNISLCQK